MENEFLGLDSNEGISSSSEQIKESQEKYQEQSKKAKSQLQKVQKDEKKAQWDDKELFEILKKFIDNEYYKPLISDITFLLIHSIPSRAILAMISLFYPEATYYTSSTVWKEKEFSAMKDIIKNEDLQDFDESSLDPSIRNWITIWVGIMDSFLTHSTTSTIMVAKFVKQLKKTYPKEIQRVLADFLIFFFQSRNIKIQYETATNYSNFIMQNLLKNLVEFLSQNGDENILQDIENISVDDLFGTK